ncbi:hypothetical protein NAV33_12815 [Pseudomonas stutzeri]|uniref:hypothetical protein n=1 Tax=Stutzerimonas stutzeri TaxID=316 RepID=UPI00210C5E56|nr:hypothetical protein [Stutzerimonas stutzeri]MCQ4312774.1 hypothetical protein [Stutzerimonas stutzeri]
MSAATLEILVQIKDHQRAALVGQSGDIRSRIEALIQEAVERYELEQKIEALLPEVIRSAAGQCRNRRCNGVLQGVQSAHSRNGIQVQPETKPWLHMSIHT